MANKLATQFTPVVNPDGARGMLLFDPVSGERQRLTITEFFDQVDSDGSFSGVFQIGGDHDSGEELTVATADALGFSTIALFRNSNAVGNIGGFAGFGKDSGAVTRTYSRLLSSIVTNTAGAQVGGMSIQTLQGSTALADALVFSGADATFSGVATFGVGQTGTSLVSINTETIADGERRGFSAQTTVGGNTRVAVLAVRKQVGQADAVSYIQLQTETGSNRFFWVDNNGIFRLDASSTNIGTTTGTAVGSQS